MQKKEKKKEKQHNKDDDCFDLRLKTDEGQGESKQTI